MTERRKLTLTMSGEQLECVVEWWADGRIRDAHDILIDNVTLPGGTQLDADELAAELDDPDQPYDLIMGWIDNGRELAAESQAEMLAMDGGVW